MDKNYLREILSNPKLPDDNEKSHYDYNNIMNILSVINYKVLI